MDELTFIAVLVGFLPAYLLAALLALWCTRRADTAFRALSTLVTSAVGVIEDTASGLSRSVGTTAGLEPRRSSAAQRTEQIYSEPSGAVAAQKAADKSATSDHWESDSSDYSDAPEEDTFMPPADAYPVRQMRGGAEPQWHALIDLGKHIINAAAASSVGTEMPSQDGSAEEEEAFDSPRTGTLRNSRSD